MPPSGWAGPAVLVEVVPVLQRARQDIRPVHQFVIFASGLK